MIANVSTLRALSALYPAAASTVFGTVVNAFGVAKPPSAVWYIIGWVRFLAVAVVPPSQMIMACTRRSPWKLEVTPPPCEWPAIPTLLRSALAASPFFA